MKKNGCLFLMMFFLLLGCQSGNQVDAEEKAELKILTEDYPPHHFKDDGEITGQATEVVRELIQRTDTDAEITMTDWQEAYQTALDQPDTALYSVVMTPGRKDQFQWVGPITVNNTNFYAESDSEISIASLDDAGEVDSIATVSGYYSEEVLKDEEGFTNLKSYPDELSALRALLDGEVQLFAGSNTVMPALLDRADEKIDRVEEVFTISTDLGYIAFSPETPSNLVDRWQEQLDAIKRDGTFDSIYAKWLPTETPPGILQLVTEEYPPITFMQDGEPSGFVTDMVREITARLDIPDNINLTSWKNAYNMALVHPNVVIFSMDRTEVREDLFHWVGPVGQNSAILFARKGSDITIDSMEDAKEVSSIATTTEWWTEQHLKSEGFTNLVSSSDPEANVRQLINGDVELSIFTDVTIPEIVQDAGYAMDDLEPVFTVEQNYFYIGISKDTPTEIVSEWQATLESMKEDGTFEDIYQNYLPQAEIEGLLNH